MSGENGLIRRYREDGIKTVRLRGETKEPYHKGVVYYLRDGRVRGVLLWNVWEQVDAARKMIAAAGTVRPGDLRGRLPA